MKYPFELQTVSLQEQIDVCRLNLEGLKADLDKCCSTQLRLFPTEWDQEFKDIKLKIEFFEALLLSLLQYQNLLRWPIVAERQSLISPLS